MCLIKNTLNNRCTSSDVIKARVSTLDCLFTNIPVPCSRNTVMIVIIAMYLITRGVVYVIGEF